MIESHQIYSDGVLCLQIISHDIEDGRKDTSGIRRVSSIKDADDVSVRLSAVGLGIGISRVGGWFGFTLVIQHTNAGATSIGSLGMPFYVGAMRDITEVPNLYLGIICVAHLVLDPVYLLEDL